MLADLRLQHYMDSCKHLQLLEKMVESNVISEGPNRQMLQSRVHVGTMAWLSFFCLIQY